MDLFSILFNISLVLLEWIFGSYLTNKQNKKTSNISEDKQLEQIVKSLLQELDFNYTILEEGLGTMKSLTGTEYEWFRGSLQSKSYESIVNSGTLTILPPEVQTIVSFYYEKLEELNFIGNQTMPMPIGNPSENVSYQKQLLSALKEAYSEIKETLTLTLNRNE